MNNYLSDKVIDDQGNVKTIAGGQDARLYYIDFEGNRKKYLLDGEAAGGSGTGDKISGYVGNADLKFTDGTAYLNADGETKKLKIGSATASNTPNLEDVDIYGEYVKTHGEGLIVYGPNQELLSVLDDELKYKGEYDISKMKVEYRGSYEDFSFKDDTYVIFYDPVTSIFLSINSPINNGVIEFTTGDTIDFTISSISHLYINKPFAFEPNKHYIIFADKEYFLWCELQNFIQ